jgi:enamine deaminase RidA (YjgF/YER057c/UK114 family)
VGVEDRLREMGIELPAPTAPIASYVPVVVSGNLAFVAGQGAIEEGKAISPGHVGGEVTVEDAQDCARRAALGALAALRAELGSLDRLRRIVSATVYVSSAPGFTGQPQVANGASDLFVELLGDAGRHARAAVGVSELPLNIPVEVVIVAEIEEAESP